MSEWRRDWRRIRKKREKLLACDAVLVSHAKCGRTWLLAMVSRYYHIRYGTPADQLIDSDNFAGYDRRIPRLFYTSGWGVDSLGGFQEILARKRVIFLYRDPRDVIVSWFHHLSSRRRAVGRSFYFRGNRVPETLTGTVALEPFWLPGVVSYMNSWLGRCKSVRRKHLLSYEAMRADPRTALRSLLEFVGEEVDEGALEEAVSFGRFENMNRLEREGFFSSGRLRGGQAQDPNSFKVRSGRVGGYRAHFPPEEADRLDAYVAANLHPEFGYSAGAEDDGAMTPPEAKRTG